MEQKHDLSSKQRKTFVDPNILSSEAPTPNTFSLTPTQILKMLQLPLGCYIQVSLSPWTYLFYIFSFPLLVHHNLPIPCANHLGLQLSQKKVFIWWQEGLNDVVASLQDVP